ncbi:MAG: 2Fe-2S iron-sulfur cluster-binding protein [Bacteroidota bacterium]|jgi:NADH-quinone oxidoreductase subunit G|nr:(2Fe-2S)-binding protein [Bacteroidota bacterium]MCA6442705.1 (2Fe-2S)-binding protein [Bacteroidota bacterium]
MKVTIDGIEIDVPKGTTILQAARMIGPEVAPPAMCYYSKLKTSGGYCRTCIVKVTQGSAANPNPMPKPVASCRTEVMDGMVVENYINKDIVEARKGVVEFLLMNHPLDCPVCDQAGECKLQDLGYQNGSEKTRYEFKRREYEVIDIGDKIKLHMNRCILCYRCVKTAEQITDGRVHGVIHRGDAAEISTYIENVIDNDFSGNVIDVCPVGALTDRTFRFKQRVWFTKPVDAHRNCTKCSGKTRVWLKGEEVVRVTARKDQWDEVEEFICNSCRYDHKKKSDWVIEGPSPIHRNSVISQNHYENLNELKVNLLKQQKALGFMPIDKKP